MQRLYWYAKEIQAEGACGHASIYRLWQKETKTWIRMTTDLHDALCKEIESHRVDDETPSMAGTLSGTSIGSAGVPHYQSRRRHTYSASISIDAMAVGHTILKNHSSQSTQKSRTLELTGKSRDFSDSWKPQLQAKTKVLMTGWLHKTTRLKTSKTRGHRQHRKFKLTAHSLEYSNLLQKVLDFGPSVINISKCIVIVGLT